MTLTAESSRIEMKLEPDPRLAAAVAGAVSHVAERLGLDPKAQTEFATAAEKACCEELPSLRGEEATLDIIVEDFPDRIEVIISPAGPAPQVRGKSTARAPRGSKSRGGARNNTRRKGVDRVFYEDRGGASYLTLIKFLPKKS